MTGRIRDITGAVIDGADAELWADGDQKVGELRTHTDQSGIYLFSGLAEGEYALKLSRPGFKSLTIRSIHLSGGQEKAIPTLELAVANIGDCGNNYVQYIRLLARDDQRGDIGGSVLLDEGPTKGDTPPIIGADVVLVCGIEVCASTTTDSKGGFTFKDLPATHSYVVRVRRAGYYVEERTGYEVQVGRELTYTPVRLELCTMGNCDPVLRPKKPLVICE